MTQKEAIVQVLKEEGIPMHYTSIANKIIKKKLIQITCESSFPSNISATIHQYKDLFASAGKRGYYMLKEDQKKMFEKYQQQFPPQKQALIKAYGKYWSRDKFEKHGSKLLGRIEDDHRKPVVDLSEEVGIYVLYRGYEIVYVGQCAKRNLAIRLKEHCGDSLNRKWNSFSWYGFSPVLDEKVVPTSNQWVLTKDIIDAFEAVLIDAIEPRFNDKAGNNLLANEYFQF